MFIYILVIGGQDTFISDDVGLASITNDVHKLTILSAILISSEFKFIFEFGYK